MVWAASSAGSRSRFCDLPAAMVLAPRTKTLLVDDDHDPTSDQERRESADRA